MSLPGKLGSTKLSNINQFLVILCLTGFVIADPVLSIFGKNSGLFHFHNVETLAALATFALIISLGPTLLIWFLCLSAEAVYRGAGLILHMLIAIVLAGLWFLSLAKWQLGIVSEPALVLVSVSGALVFLCAYLRFPMMLSCLQIAAIVPVIRVLLFLFASEASTVTTSFVEDKKPLIYTPKTEYPSVLFILLDELPTMSLFNEAGGIDSERFPNLLEFSQQATWYRHYSVLAATTERSVPAILTGNSPKSLAPSFSNYPDNLFSLLAPTHYLTVFEALTGLCKLPQCSKLAPGAAVQRTPPELPPLLTKAVSLWLDRISLSNRQGARYDDFSEKLIEVAPAWEKAGQNQLEWLIDPENQTGFAKKKPEKLQKFVDTFVEGEKSALYFIHLELPHTPWRFYSSGQLYDLPLSWPGSTLNHTNGGQWLARMSEHRHLLQAQYTDRLLGDVFEGAKAQGLWDDMLVVITSDHGRSFGPGTMGRDITPETYDSIAYSPLLIKRPGQTQGIIDDSNLMAYDLLPTIADMLDITIPWEVEGLAAGTKVIARHGTEKYFFPKKYSDKFLSELGERLTFDDSKQFPQFISRHIGELLADMTPLEMLNEPLGLSGYIGSQTADFTVQPGGRAVVEELELLRRPESDRAPLGLVMGNLEFDAPGGLVLVAVNNIFVSASPLVELSQIENTFVMMLPPGALKKKNEITLYLLQNGSLFLLEIH